MPGFGPPFTGTRGVEAARKLGIRVVAVLNLGGNNIVQAALVKAGPGLSVQLRTALAAADRSRRAAVFHPGGRLNNPFELT